MRSSKVRAHDALDQTRTLFFSELQPDQFGRPRWRSIMRRFQNNVKSCRYEHAVTENSQCIMHWTYRYSISQSELRPLDNVECLDVSTSAPGVCDQSAVKLNLIVNFLARLMPNLRAINVSGVEDVYIQNIFRFCPHLESFTMAHQSGVVEDLVYGRRLRELYNSCSSIAVNDVEFSEQFQGGWDEQASADCWRYGAADTPDVILECLCNQLESVDVKGASLNVCVRKTSRDWDWAHGWMSSRDCSVLLPEAALVKFVRHAPALRWFRSNLSAESVAMLQVERPDVIFV